jgi:hypothetical protein
LPIYEKEKSIEDILITKRIPIENIEDLKNSPKIKILFLFDGFDELSIKTNII